MDNSAENAGRSAGRARWAGRLSPWFRPPLAVRIDALDVPSSAANWLGIPAIEQQLREARAAGLSEGEGADVITLTPGAVASRGALRAFVEVSSAITGDVVGVLPPELDAFQRPAWFGAEPRLVRLRGGGGCDAERVSRATQVVIPSPIRRFPVRLADGPGGRSEDFLLSDVVLGDTSHWASLLWSNLLAMGPWMWRALLGPPWWAPFRVMAAVMRARSLDPMVVAGRLNRRGKRARIHPSAVVEGCWLGDGVTVGPGAVVRGSIVGAGSSIESQADVSFSVLAAETTVQRRGIVRYAVTHEQAMIGGGLQLGVVGPGVALKHGATLLDQNWGSPVQVRRDGRSYPAPLGLIGVGVGARTVVGAGVLIAPGRTVPAELLISPSGNSVVRRIPAGIAGSVEVVDGELRPR